MGEQNGPAPDLAADLVIADPIELLKHLEAAL
jgi:hypothetical protein